MSKREKTTTVKKIDTIKWVFILLLLVLAVLANNYFVLIAGPIKMIAWIFVILATLGIAVTTVKGTVLLEFAKGSRMEMQKVVWPTRQETVQTTLMVIAMVIFVALVLWGLDSVLMWAVGKITGLG